MVPEGALLSAQMSARLPVHYERIKTRHSPLIGLRLRDRGVAVPAGATSSPLELCTLAMLGHWHCRRSLSSLGAALFHDCSSGERERGDGWRTRVCLIGRRGGEGGFTKRLLACNGGRRGRGVARHALQPQAKQSIHEVTVDHQFTVIIHSH